MTQVKRITIKEAEAINSRIMEIIEIFNFEHTRKHFETYIDVGQLRRIRKNQFFLTINIHMKPYLIGQTLEELFQYLTFRTGSLQTIQPSYKNERFTNISITAYIKSD